MVNNYSTITTWSSRYYLNNTKSLFGLKMIHLVSKYTRFAEVQTKSTSYKHEFYKLNKVNSQKLLINMHIAVLWI